MIKAGTTVNYTVLIPNLPTSKEVGKVIFTFKTKNDKVSKHTDQEHDGTVVYENGAYVIPLTQEDTEKLQGEVSVEAQINYTDKSVDKTPIEHCYINDTLATEKVTGNKPTDKNVDLILEIISGVDTGNYYNKQEADEKFQEKLTAGANINIDENNVISATGGAGGDYTAGNGIDIDNNVISVDLADSELDFTNGKLDIDLSDYGKTLSLAIDSSTYVLTASLKNGNTTLSSATVDLPLESMVVSGSYDSATKEVVLTLKSGDTVRFSVADLVSGLQTEITPQNKLDADLVDDSESTNKFTNATEKAEWNGKPNVFSGSGKPTNVVADYDGVKVNDLYIDISTSGTITQLWTCYIISNNTVNWQPDNKTIFKGTTPYANAQEQVNATNVSTLGNKLFLTNNNKLYIQTDIGTPPNFNFTWVKLADMNDLATKSRFWEAKYRKVDGYYQVDKRVSRYEGIKQNDLIFDWYFVTGTATDKRLPLKIYKVGTVGDTTFVLDEITNRFGVISSTPPDFYADDERPEYAVGDVVFSTNGNAYLCTSLTVNEEEEKILTWQTFKGTDTTYSAGTGLSLSNGAFSVDNPVPSGTSSDYGKYLKNNNGQLEWASVSGGSYSGGDGIDITNNTISVDLKSGTELQITSGELDIDLSNYATTTSVSGKEDKTTISTDTTSTTVSLTLADNHEYRYTQDLTSLTLTMPSGDFISSIVFASGSTPTSMTYDSSIKWSGNDVTNGQFVPTEKTYNIVMWYDGINVNGVVRGV